MKNKIIFKNNDLLIRYPSIKDLPGINKYINNLSREKTYVRYQRDIINLNEEKKYLKEQLIRINEKKSIELIVEMNNKIIGISSIDLYDGAQKHEGVLGISISKEYRKNGIGKILLEQMINEAKLKLKDLELITLSVFENNKIGLKFYQDFGFTEYGKLPNGIIYKNKYYDQILMYKKI